MICNLGDPMSLRHPVHVTWPINICNMTHSRMQQDPSICMRDMTRFYLWRDSLILWLVSLICVMCTYPIICVTCTHPHTCHEVGFYIYYACTCYAYRKKKNPCVHIRNPYILSICRKYIYIIYYIYRNPYAKGNLFVYVLVRNLSSQSI